MNLHPKQVCLLFLVSLALTRAEPLPANANINTNEIDDKLPEKPEPRQIGAVMPYAWIQPAQAMAAAAAPAISSWGSTSPSWWNSIPGTQSILQFFRPNPVGGRRSSLSSRLRNLMNALFYRRETSSGYMPSGSSYSYSFRPPPFGFNSGFSAAGLGQGLGSSLGSSLGSALGTQNLYGSASYNRPVVLPNYGSSPTDAWSNYKQFASGASMPANWGSSSSGSGSPSGAIWQSGSSSGSGSQYSALASSAYPSFSSGSGVGSSNAGYQSAASNAYPQTSYQRSSISSYSKPQVSANPSTSVSSSVSVSSSSSSASSLQNPKSVGFQTK